MNDTIIVRIAPSPTGPLHIGTARTALFNWLYARQHKGIMMLRIEDTDRDRSLPEFEKSIVESLTWLGLTWDNDIVYQSERGDEHKKAIATLLEQGSAFYCFHTPEEREEEREQQRIAKKPFLHTCEHFTFSPEKRDKRVHSEESFVIRFRPPPEEIVAFEDAVRHRVEFSTNDLGDFSVAKSLDEPLYNLAVVVDDHDMGITDVIRGEDHISNTPKQILLYNALGWPVPRFAHLPLIFGTDKTKLSKRDGATAMLDFRDEGYLPEAMVNFLGLLGWHPREDEEKADVTQMLAEFKLSDVQKGAAIFDRAKLDWLNGRYIRSLELKELEERVRPFLKQDDIVTEGDIDLTEVLRIVRDRMVTLRDASEGVRLFVEEPTVTRTLLTWKKMKHPETEIQKMLETALALLSKIGEEAWREKHLQEFLSEQAETIGDGDKGMLLWPLRVALSGQAQSPGPHEIAGILGKERTLKRIRVAIDTLNA